MIRKHTLYVLALPLLALLAAGAALIPSHLPIAAVLLLAAAGGWVYLRSKKCRQSVSLIYVGYLTFLFFQFSLAQTNTLIRLLGYALEAGILLALAVITVSDVGKLRHGVREYNLFFWLGAMVLLDVVSTALTYGDLFVTVFSLYDTCRYLILMFCVMALRPTEKEVHALLRVLSVIVLVQAVLAIIQFTGNHAAFSHFVGRYTIVRRNGQYRSVGTFFHGIDLGNFAAVMFALFYNYNKYHARSKYYTLICLLAALCTFLSGTRTAMANVLIIFLLSNLRNVKSWLRSITVLLLAGVLVLNFFDWELYLSRARIDFTSETPRNYYLAKGAEVWKDHPLLGIGFGTFGAQRYRERTDDQIFQQYDISKYADTSLATTDSFLAELLPEYGLVGIGLIGMLVYLVVYVYRRKVRQAAVYRAALALMLSVCILSINSSTGFFNPNVGSLFWITVGLILSRGDSSVKTRNPRRQQLRETGL